MSKTIAAILNAIAQFDTIIIHRHLNPDPDALGSQIGLKRLIEAAYPDKTVIAAGPDVPDLAWIGPQTRPEASSYQDALVIIIDTATIDRIAGEYALQGKMTIKIDHHLETERFGDLAWNDTHASSSSEMVWTLQKASDKLHLTASAANALYAGLIGDTGRFLYDLTQSSTHLAAADLLQAGADAPAIGRKEDEFPALFARLIGWGLSQVTISPEGVGTLLITTAQREAFGLDYGQEQRVVGQLGKIAEIDRWAVFSQRPEGGYRCELRGKTVAVNAVAVAHGGGGHPLASGCVAKDADEIQAITTDLQELK